jgi:hypothetical protein
VVVTKDKNHPTLEKKIPSQNKGTCLGQTSNLCQSIKTCICFFGAPKEHFAWHTKLARFTKKIAHLPKPSLRKHVVIFIFL